MIITEPNDFVAEVHDRMPALLTEDRFAPWLSGDAGAEMLKSAPNDDYLQRWPVSSGSIVPRLMPTMRSELIRSKRPWPKSNRRGRWGDFRAASGRDQPVRFAERPAQRLPF
jgi:hypothetical protein